MADPVPTIGGPDDPRHGTAYGYRRLGCRCDRRREANRVQQVDYMARTPKQREAARQRNLLYMRQRRRQAESDN